MAPGPGPHAPVGGGEPGPPGATPDPDSLELYETVPLELTVAAIAAAMSPR